MCYYLYLMCYYLYFMKYGRVVRRLIYYPVGINVLKLLSMMQEPVLRLSFPPFLQGAQKLFYVRGVRCLRLDLNVEHRISGHL